MSLPYENATSGIAMREEWWYDEFVRSKRLPDGTFPLYSFGLCGTIHGEQYMAPWMMHRRINGYFVDDFGDWHLC